MWAQVLRAAAGWEWERGLGGLEAGWLLVRGLMRGCGVEADGWRGAARALFGMVGVVVVAEMALGMLRVLRIAAVGPRVVKVRCVVEAGEGVELMVVAELALNMLVMLRIVAVGPRVVTVRCVVGAAGEMGQVEELKRAEEVVAVGAHGVAVVLAVVARKW